MTTVDKKLYEFLESIPDGNQLAKLFDKFENGVYRFGTMYV